MEEPMNSPAGTPGENRSTAVSGENASPSGAGKTKQKKSGAALALRILDVLCAISGVFFAAVYLPYFFWHLPKGHIADVIVSLGVFLFVLLPFSLRRLLQNKLGRAYLPLKCAWCFAMVFYMISFSVFSLVISLHSDAPAVGSGKQTVVIVFGCQVHADGSLSQELHSRLDSAAAVLEEYPDALCVLSGGKGEDEGMSEALAMKKYLVDMRGLNADRLLVEDRSSDTGENIDFSLSLLKEKGYDPAACSFICVSSTFHTPRIHLLFGRRGLDCATVSAPTPNVINAYVYTVREYMSYVKLFVFGNS